MCGHYAPLSFLSCWSYCCMFMWCIGNIITCDPFGLLLHNAWMEVKTLDDWSHAKRSQNAWFCAGNWCWMDPFLPNAGLVCSAEVSPDDLFAGTTEVEEPSLMVAESLRISLLEYVFVCIFFSPYTRTHTKVLRCTHRNSSEESYVYVEIWSFPNGRWAISIESRIKFCQYTRCSSSPLYQVKAHVVWCKANVSLYPHQNSQLI